MAHWRHASFDTSTEQDCFTVHDDWMIGGTEVPAEQLRSMLPALTAALADDV